MRYSHAELAAALSTPTHRVHRPTAQQAVVIDAPVDAPALVVAGAGSGKTETMAFRVVHLVANGLVDRPDQVLGLTFTRKAALELAQRISDRLDRLRSVGILAPDTELEPPTVATYNAWAGSIYREHALSIGRDPDAELLGDAAAWRLARQVVVEHGGAELQVLEKRVGEIAELVVALSNAIVDNVAELGEIDAFAAEFARVRDLPDGEATRKDQREAPEEAAVRVGALRLLLPLVRHYQAAKQRQGRIEYTDQVADALAICRDVPQAAEAIRARHRVVLLDEYQDTSVIQTRLLSELFRDRGVMAVGDPNQSIYGWRGASASNLASFRADFSSTPGEVAIHPLSRSWRNPPAVLAAANELAAPLRAASPIHVEELDVRDDPVIGRFDVVYPETVDDEVEEVVGWLARRLAEPDGDEPPDAAIILHKREHMQRFGDALARRGIAYRIVGGGGLLGTPEVTDLVAQLRVLIDANAGSDLIRLLAGARWRIGTKDLKALRDLARWLGDRDARQQLLDQEVRDARRRSGVPADGTSNVEALDFLVDAPSGHSRLAEFSDAGLERLRRFGGELRRLRGRLGLPLPDLIAHVEEAMRLDIEVVANDVSATGLANLRAFRREAETFAGLDERGTLSAFLDWVDRALRNDRELGPADPPSEPGTVQLITVHGAKGLEWDIVAIPRMVEGEFPATAKSDSTWVRLGALPFPFRRDHEALPELDWRGARDRKDFKDRLDAFHDALKARFAEEERRLVYVAITRTRRDLLLSGSWWATQRRPRGPGEYLARLAERGLIGPLPEAPLVASNPIDVAAGDLTWPLEPLGGRRGRVERAARLVEQADGALPIDAPWAKDLELLLAEHAARDRRPSVEPPARIPASGFKDWVGDAARAAERVLRPMPEQPYRATRLGTLFHAWAEDRYRTRAAESLFDLDDDASDDGDAFAGLAPGDEASLAALKERFERSEWAFLEPIAVEQSIELPFAGRTIPCKIDAVFERDGRIEIVDWKTGKAPRTAQERAAFDYQLALYRLAWSRAYAVPIDEIDAKAYFVADDIVYAPIALPDEDELLRRWEGAVAALASPAADAAASRR